MDLFLLFLKIGASIQKKRYQPCVEVATKLLMKRILFTIVGYFTCYIWNIVGPENDRVCLENNAPRTLVINEFSNSFFSLQFSFYIQSDSRSRWLCYLWCVRAEVSISWNLWVGGIGAVVEASVVSVLWL